MTIRDNVTAEMTVAHDPINALPSERASPQSPFHPHPPDGADVIGFRYGTP